jgi:hypothetical protein
MSARLLLDSKLVASPKGTGEPKVFGEAVSAKTRTCTNACNTRLHMCNPHRYMSFVGMSCLTLDCACYRVCLDRPSRICKLRYASLDARSLASFRVAGSGLLVVPEIPKFQVPRPCRDTEIQSPGFPYHVLAWAPLPKALLSTPQLLIEADCS